MIRHIKTPSIKALKGRYPFRLATTSFIHPAGWAENVARLAPCLDEVELLFFESRSPGSLPDEAELNRLAQLAAEYDLTYTIHLPVDVDLGAQDRADRQLAVKTLSGIYFNTARLPVSSYTLHLAYPAEAPRQEEDVHRWQARTRQGLTALMDAGVEHHRFSIETLDYPFEWAAPLVESLDLRVCLDIGHLIIYADKSSAADANSAADTGSATDGESARANLTAALDRYLHRTTVIHLHGVKGAKDHRPLDDLDDDLLKMVIGRLQRHGYAASLSLEVFGLKALERSLACFATAWDDIKGNR